MLGTREYLAEYLGTALLLLIGLSAVCADFAVRSPVVSALPDESMRRLLTAVIFAGVLTAIVYSPLGRRSGAHLNPAVTLAFWLLGKITARSAMFYVAAQIAGGLTGAALVLALWGEWATNVHVGATVPKAGGPFVALVAETAMVFLLVGVILTFVDRPRLMALTGVAAGTLVAVFVFVEAPVSGASLNPARTLGPAVVGGTFTDLWVYLVGPPLGALLVALLYRHRRSTVACGKLFHTDTVDCRFVDCKYTPRHHNDSARGAANAPIAERNPEMAMDQGETQSDRPE
jgi:aquaporin Z